MTVIIFYHDLKLNQRTIEFHSLKNIYNFILKSIEVSFHFQWNSDVGVLQ